MSETTRLRTFLKNNFSFSDLKKVGFFKPEVKSTDYQAQATRICHFFGLKNIYDYASIGKGARVHISEDGEDNHPLPLFARTIKDRFGEEVAKIIESELNKIK